ncbi:MAG: S-layer homology domain-containing protein [Romboutsia timonensis]|uniref:S-layer homology domain-containing protein n=1 Tax=Romboutsia timonensis TaxID=1776391 RepID=UPI002A757A13|nr:S-layer homology domain-containing protein [Romboutsia timonensis]MDY3001606.1 S-layer homology domain-containing protein [Romboutsia timonensis]
MKNKKSIAMAMAAVSTLGAVAPAFANEVAPLALTDLTVDYRLANGEELVKQGRKVRVLEGRSALYNDNFTPDDKSDDTFKNEFKDATILVSKNTNDKDDANDLYVLVKKVTDTSDITMEKAKLEAMIAEIKKAKEEGATVEVGELKKAKITDKKNFEDSQIKVTVTDKEQKTPKEYIFNGVPGIEEEVEVQVNPFVAINGKNTLDINVAVSDINNVNEGQKNNYYQLNKFKFIAEQNKDKFDFVKYQDDAENKNLVIKVYKKGYKQIDANVKYTVTLSDFAKLENKLIINIASTTDFGNHWAKEEIVEAMLKGQVDVAENFRPQDGITRAEFAKIACTIFSDKIDMKNADKGEPFHDVENGEWYQKYVAALYNTKVGKESIIKGDGENFRPNDKITRQEVAVIVAKLHANKSIETIKKDVNGNEVHKVVEVTNFKDYKSIAPWADESVKHLNDNGIVKGSEGYFNPTQAITRAEALVMVQRAESATTN